MADQAMGLVSVHQSFIGIDQRICDGGHPSHMPQDPPDEPIGLLAEPLGICLVGEYIFPIF